MATYFADLHCHSTLYPYNQLKPTAWYEHNHLLYPSQGDFIKLAKGNLRVLFISLYPIEQGFLILKQPGLETGDITDLLSNVIFSMPKERADEIQNMNHNYFNDLIGEYEFLKKFADPVREKIRMNLFKSKNFKYKIISNFDELKSLLNLDSDLNPQPPTDDTIAVIPTIEGAHCLGVGQRNTQTLDFSTLKQTVIENIAKLKMLGPPGKEGSHCPFFVTLSHHFWNQLAGHSVSLWGIIRKVFDQNNGINENVHELGKIAITALLSNTGGKRRILIDVAHMSIKARQWYYNAFLPGYEAATGGKIPIIASHTGVNGKVTMAEAEMIGNPDTIHNIADDLYAHSTKFNPWDVLLSDEEIFIIHKSGGLIGLNLDQRIMMGKETLENTKKNVKWKLPNAARVTWVQPYLEEILHIARHICLKTGSTAGIWDNIAIGSDFGGMITPIKGINNATRFPDLDRIIYQQLCSRKTSETILNGKTNSQIQEITDKIMWKNALLFLQKHYH